jgi:hypothetical protein
MTLDTSVIISLDSLIIFYLLKTGLVSENQIISEFLYQYEWLSYDHSLANRIIEFCVASRKSLRRVLHMPYDSHRYLLSLLSGTLPVFTKMQAFKCALFLPVCLNSRSILIQSIDRYGINFARCKSCVGRNALFSCNYFTWQLSECLTGIVSSSNYSYMNFCSTHRSVFGVSNAI